MVTTFLRSSGGTWYLKRHRPHFTGIFISDVLPDKVVSRLFLVRVVLTLSHPNRYPIFLGCSGTTSGLLFGTQVISTWSRRFGYSYWSAFFCNGTSEFLGLPPFSRTYTPRSGGGGTTVSVVVGSRHYSMWISTRSFFILNFLFVMGFPNFVGFSIIDLTFTDSIVINLWNPGGGSWKKDRRFTAPWKLVLI